MGSKEEVPLTADETSPFVNESLAKTSPPSREAITVAPGPPELNKEEQPVVTKKKRHKKKKAKDKSYQEPMEELTDEPTEETSEEATEEPTEEAPDEPRDEPPDEPRKEDTKSMVDYQNATNDERGHESKEKNHTNALISANHSSSLDVNVTDDAGVDSVEEVNVTKENGFASGVMIPSEAFENRNHNRGVQIGVPIACVVLVLFGFWIVKTRKRNGYQRVEP